jgi:hypothetical protein
MDLSINNAPQVVYAVQGDTNTRNVVIDLYNAGSAWTVPDGTSGVVKFQKADGKGGIYDKIPNGFPAVVYEENSNQIEVSLAPQALTFPGEVKTQVSLIYDNNIISTFSFVVLVQADPGANVEKSTDYVNWDRYFIPQTSGATVGQYLKITKVDSLGRVIEVSPVDAPSGSGAIDGELDMKSNSILNVGTVEFWNEDELATVIIQSEFPEGDNESEDFNGVIEFRTSRGDEPVVIRNVADAKNPNEAVNRKQLDESMDHKKLSNRDAEDQHPISAISGLEQKLKDLGSSSSGIHVGSDEPTNENINIWINPDAEDTSVLVEAPATAKVGQTIIVKSVDENGIPTEWEAVDMPSGGSSGGGSILLTSVDCDEEVSVVSIPPFDAKHWEGNHVYEIYIKATIGSTDIRNWGIFCNTIQDWATVALVRNPTTLKAGEDYYIHVTVRKDMRNSVSICYGSAKYTSFSPVVKSISNYMPDSIESLNFSVFTENAVVKDFHLRMYEVPYENI